MPGPLIWQADFVETVPLLAVGLVLVCAGASCFFSLAETALFSLSKWQVRTLSAQGPRGALVARLLAAPQDLLATIAFGNTFATAAMVSLGLWMGMSGRWPFWISLAAILLLALFVGEVLPKIFGVREPEVWARRVAHPLHWSQCLTQLVHRGAQWLSRRFMAAVIPASIQPQSGLTDADYQELVEFAFQQGNLAQSARDIILQIVNLDRRTAREVMRPRAQMAAIPDDLSVEEMLETARRARHQRLPMYDETPDTIVGILNTRALLLDPHADLAEAIEFPSFVPESMNLLQLFKSLQRQKRGMAVVMDEFGGVAGLVTMEDILAELVGKFHHPVAAAGLVMEKLAPGRWRVNGTMRLDDFRREVPELPDLPGTETLGGLLTRLLDVIPAAGEATTYRGLKLTAQVVDERRVRELLVEQVK